MNMKKNGLLKGIIACIMTVMTTGCEKTDLKKLAEEALQKKYNETFVASDYKGSRLQGDYYTIYAYSESYPDITFRADVNADGSDVSDNYAAKRLGMKISDAAAMSLKDFGGEYYVYAHPMIEDFYTNNADLSIEEFVSSFPSNTFNINVYVDQESEDIEKIYDGLSTLPSSLSTMKGSINVCFVQHGSLKDVQNAIEETDDLNGDAYKKLMNDSYTIHMPFEKGGVSLTKGQFMNEVKS